MFHLSSLVVSREDYLLVGGCNPHFRLAQDHDLMLKLLALGRPIAHISTIETTYVMHENNRSGRYWEAFYYRQRVLADHRRSAAERGDPAVIAACDRGLARARELVSYQAIDAARIAYRSKRLAECVRHLARAVRVDPSVAARSICVAIRTRLPIAIGRKSSTSSEDRWSR
jgi:hypothetical protein